MAKKASRVASEGKTFVIVDKNKALIGELNCETDFASQSPDFVALTKKVSEDILKNGYPTVESAKIALDRVFIDAGVKIGEKLDLRRFEIYHKTLSQGFGSYIHGNGKISVLVILKKPDEALAKGLAMHIAANAPLYVSKENVPADIIASERALFTKTLNDDPKMASKPAAIKASIIEGQLDKYLAESILLLQPYLLDGESKVLDVVKKAGNEIVSFVRYGLGDGIVKEQADFASDVMAQIK
jgi:elongation factor Ts